METIEDLTISYTEEDGTMTVKELSKEVLTKGAWATVMFKHQDLERASGEYGEPKVTIKRFRKTGGVYRAQSKFTISSAKQARQMIDILQRWFPESAED
jgi:hypothetical protein